MVFSSPVPVGITEDARLMEVVEHSCTVIALNADHGGMLSRVGSVNGAARGEPVLEALSRLDLQWIRTGATEAAHQSMNAISAAGMVTKGRIMSRSSCSRMWQW